MKKSFLFPAHWKTDGGRYRIDSTSAAVVRKEAPLQVWDVHAGFRHDACRSMRRLENGLYCVIPTGAACINPAAGHPAAGNAKGWYLSVQRAENLGVLKTCGGTEERIVLFAGAEWLSAARKMHKDLPLWLKKDGAHLQKQFFPLNPAVLLAAGQLKAADAGRSFMAHTVRITLVAQLWLAVVRQMEAEAGKSAVLPRMEDRQRLKELTDLLHSGAADHWNLAQMAAHCLTNVTSLQRRFKQHHGVSIRAYLRKLQLERACRALQAGSTVGEAAGLAGYGHIESFSKAFKQEYGCNPVSLRRTG